jgi:pSer/pThr/pTyr-binding forkhead associated (FHA) protein
MPKITIYLKRKRIGEIAIGDALVRIGRHPEADVFLPNQSVSREHATIEGLGATWILEDAGGSNGVWINGQRAKERSLKNGDKIEIGNYILHFQLTDSERVSDLLGTEVDGNANEAKPENVATAQPTGMEAHDATFMMNPTEILAQRKKNVKTILPHLEWSGDDGRPVIVNLKTRECTVGSGNDAEIQIPGGFLIGASHATISRTRNGFCITPQNWWGSVRVNGAKVKGNQVLKDGDQVQIGGTVMVFHDALFKPGRK